MRGLTSGDLRLGYWTQRVARRGAYSIAFLARPLSSELPYFPIPAPVDPEEDVTHANDDDRIDDQDEEQKGVTGGHFVGRRL